MSIVAIQILLGAVYLALWWKACSEPPRPPVRRVDDEWLRHAKEWLGKGRSWPRHSPRA